ncbi:MAG: hypothetical protein E2O47_04080 [Gemmatimonadetes bacterium]|nr:MAG: hypothetical protein E2O47_04080 [Gemmatimonadota bacterium]
MWHYLSLADAANHGQSMHDSMLVESGACIARIQLGQVPDSLQEDRAGDCRSVAVGMTRRFPHDPDSWVALGVAGWELRDLIDVPAELGTPSGMFDSALTKDPGYGLAYAPALMVAGISRNFPALRQLTIAFRDFTPPFHPPERFGGNIQLVAQLLDPDADTIVTNQLLDTLSSCVVESVAYDRFLLVFVDSAESTIQIGRALNARPDLRCLFTHGNFALRYLGAQLIQRGHLVEAYTVVRDSHAGWFPTVFPELAIYGGVPPEIADSVFQDWLASDGSSGLDWVAWWWAQRGDTASIKQYISRRADNKNRVSSAFLALARRDTATALAEFAVADQHGMTMHYWPLVHARLLIATGKDREAREAIRWSPPGIGWLTLTHGFWSLERARVAERLGETEQAVRDYQDVMDVWLHADESLQGYVEESREALERLAS